mmetsp:Transcript_4309/g.3138  ORF Transcript_4309/g.3138 Transcript_4309/m.3138 type:complete len:95 (-) Transcript_4309:30-314(-)
MKLIFHYNLRKQLDKSILKYDVLYYNNPHIQLFIQRRVSVAEDAMKPTEVLAKRLVFKHGKQHVVFTSSVPDSFYPAHPSVDRNYALWQFDVFE